DVDVVEYKYTIREDIARIKKMGVKQLPSLYINGELKWSSIIPSRTELFDELKKYQ
ncbi:thioredoxin family protein, partial [Tissierella creatinini]